MSGNGAKRRVDSGYCALYIIIAERRGRAPQSSQPRAALAIIIVHAINARAASMRSGFMRLHFRRIFIIIFYYDALDKCGSLQGLFIGLLRIFFMVDLLSVDVGQLRTRANSQTQDRSCSRVDGFMGGMAAGLSWPTVCTLSRGCAYPARPGAAVACWVRGWAGSSGSRAGSPRECNTDATEQDNKITIQEIRMGTRPICQCYFYFFLFFSALSRKMKILAKEGVGVPGGRGRGVYTI